MTMLRRPVRNPVFAAWKRNVRRISLFPRPSFLILKVTRPYLFVFALSGVTPRANTRTTAPRAARPLALTVTVTRRPFVHLDEPRREPQPCQRGHGLLVASVNCCAGLKSPMFLSSSWAATRHQNVPPERYAEESSVGA